MALVADIDDASLERLAQEKGVATLVKTAPPVEEGSQPKPVRAAKPKPNPKSVPTPRNRMRNLNIEVPDYVWTDLKIRAAHRQTSVRHVLLVALRDLGVPIRKADLIDTGRNGRESSGEDGLQG